MSGKFDLRTAASLLPSMDGTEDVTKKLVEDLYNDFLDASEKSHLIKYILKARVSTRAKLRLKTQYNTVEELITDMKNNLLTRKAPAAISRQLHNVRQENRSIEEFAKVVEQLLVYLTLAQADNDDRVVHILQPINEKLATNSFANGLKSNELRTIIKARNYENLKDAIMGAKEAEIGRSPQNSIYHVRGRNFNNRGFRSRSNFNNFNNQARRFNNNFNNNNNFRQSSYSYNNCNSPRSHFNSHNNNNNNNYRHQHTRFQGQSRGRSMTWGSAVVNRGRGTTMHRGYFAEGAQIEESCGEWFFRV
ncbi:probable serine/threonine-protein kinase dyrk1 [Anthonomus grandis grandis]|uniref:probable serine/threonine-protein kinase dyrk1 n=1 Tax=Anthonomus grandis grandis TaxID=2921223 RepID=UPI0021650453|nr:probable serine/threonine-protein kinase dyrk1 [Anthonomus grandis grandis]